MIRLRQSIWAAAAGAAIADAAADVAVAVGEAVMAAADIADRSR